MVAPGRLARADSLHRIWPRLIRIQVHCAARRQRGKPLSTAFVESEVNEIVTKRMNKKQQMRWNRATVQPFLDVRTAVLNETLEDAFRGRYPRFRPTNDADTAIAMAA